jgi:sulfide dehydrogenase [flavocytochrome c] flavoprotein subunit
VVVIGGGFGGTIAAKYIKQADPSIHVTLVERNTRYVTAPFSNTVLAGIHDLAFITRDYSVLRDKHGIEVVHDVVTAIDADAKTVSLKQGRELDYDRLVISPGIELRWADTEGAIDGYDLAASNQMPHAWKGSDQLLLLRARLKAMDDGGVVIISVPAGPISGPSAPYERASLIAYFLKMNKPRAKVLILDGNSSFTNQALFVQGWQALYPGMIEWVSAADGGAVVRVDAGKGMVYSESAKYKGSVVNVIPPQRAAGLAQLAGLADDNGWCPVDQRSFESLRRPGIHVIGDASMAGEMPKSGFAANSQGKVVAAAVSGLLNGRAPGEPSYLNTCYSLFNTEYGISEAEVYRLAANGRITAVPGAGGRSTKNGNRLLEAAYADSWYANITADMFA